MPKPRKLISSQQPARSLVLVPAVISFSSVVSVDASLGQPSEPALSLAQQIKRRASTCDLRPDERVVTGRHGAHGGRIEERTQRGSHCTAGAEAAACAAIVGGQQIQARLVEWLRPAGVMGKAREHVGLCRALRAGAAGLEQDKEIGAVESVLLDGCRTHRDEAPLVRREPGI